MCVIDRRNNRGFTLIEVLISLIIVVIGVVAILQLQGVFLNTVSDAEKRAVGYRLAEDKIEELRAFDNRYIFYKDIVDTPIPTTSTPIPNVVYSIDVDVDNYIASGGSLILTASSSLAEVKEVKVTVSWEGQSLALASMIASVEPNVSPLLGLGNIGSSTPDVNYSVGQAPDVVAIEVGDDKLKETSKPLPEVKSQNRSTVVQFETVTYRDSTKNQLVQDDYLTVNCTCTFSPDTATISTPYHYDLSELNGTYTLSLVAGKQVEAYTGVPKTGVDQSDQFCTRCCAGHHDAIDSSVYVDIPSFKGTGSHDHYRFDSTGTKPDVNLTGPVFTGDYLEACRFVRVDGMYRLAPDWNMIALNAMPRSILVSSASSSLSTYQDYVVAKVQQDAFGLLNGASGSDVSAAAAAGAASAQSLAASLAAASAHSTISGEQTQFLSRGLYLDDMTYDQDWIDYMTSVAASPALLSSGDWLEFVPFNEVNMTLLSTWDPETGNTIATVTNDDVNQTIEVGTDYYVVYSRGVVEGGSTPGSTAISAVSKTDNTGILGNTYADVPQVPLGTDHAGYDNRIVSGAIEMTASVEVTNNLCSTACIVAGVIPIKTTGNTTIADIEALNLAVSASDEIACTLDDLTDDTIATLVLETGQMRYRCTVGVASDPYIGSVSISGTTASSIQTKSFTITGGVGALIDFSLVTP